MKLIHESYQIILQYYVDNLNNILETQNIFFVGDDCTYLLQKCFFIPSSPQAHHQLHISFSKL